MIIDPLRCFVSLASVPPSHPQEETAVLREFFDLLPRSFSAEGQAANVIDPLERMYKDKMQVGPLEWRRRGLSAECTNGLQNPSHSSGTHSLWCASTGIYATKTFLVQDGMACFLLRTSLPVVLLPSSCAHATASRLFPFPVSLWGRIISQEVFEELQSRRATVSRQRNDNMPRNDSGRLWPSGSSMFKSASGKLVRMISLS